MADEGAQAVSIGAWRLAVFTPVSAQAPASGYLFEMVRTPNNRIGAKAADARLAQLVAAIEEGREPAARPSPMRTY